MNMKKFVKVLKLKELEDAQTPNNKEVGYYKEGIFEREPIPGEEFLLYREFGEGRTIPIWHTSIVTEIISADTFRTKNSIYQIIDLP